MRLFMWVLFGFVKVKGGVTNLPSFVTGKAIGGLSIK